jgi:large subunit ribosomal protein L11
MKVIKKYFTKKGLHRVKFMLVAKAATPGASIATLGQKQVPMKQFCDLFNQNSPNVIKEKLMPEACPSITEEILTKNKLYVKMRIYNDKTWEIRINNPSTSHLIKALSKISTGSKLPGKESAGTISKKLAMEIANFKMPEMTARNPEAALKSVIGTASSMGIKVVEE